MTNGLEQSVAAHYTRTGLLDAILEGLAAQGANLDALTPADLAPVDEFHTAGRTTTLRAAEMMPLRDDMHLLDAGSGIGGTSRFLAHEKNCRVTGVDLTPAYVEVADELTRRMGLGERCRFHVGSITDLTFDDASFDGAVNFHVAMNIADRDRLYGELARVVRPGGFLCVFDVMKGPAAGMRYPVPWAETAETSFLMSRDETLAAMEQAGFALNREENLRDFAIGFFDEIFAKAATSGGPPPLGLHLLTGQNAPEKFANYAVALKEHQIEPVIMVADRA